MAPAEAVLEALAEASPASLADAACLRRLHGRCAAAGLVPAGLASADAGEDVARLHALFHLALASNLVAVVVHYVQEARPLRAAGARARAAARRGRSASRVQNPDPRAEQRVRRRAPRLSAPARAHRCAWTRWRCPVTPRARI